MKYYDTIATGYNELHGEEQEIKLDVIKRNIKLTKNTLLLDVGAGSGISSNLNCKVVSLDPSIELTNQNKNENKLVGRAEKLPFKNETFNIVISVTAIHNFQDYKEGLKEMNRVGKQEFAFSILKKSEEYKKILYEITNSYKIKKIINSEKDTIIFCTKTK